MMKEFNLHVKYENNPILFFFSYEYIPVGDKDHE